MLNLYKRCSPRKGDILPIVMNLLKSNTSPALNVQRFCTKKLHRFTPDVNRIIDTCTIYSFVCKFICYVCHSKESVNRHMKCDNEMKGEGILKTAPLPFRLRGRVYIGFNSINR